MVLLFDGLTYLRDYLGDGTPWQPEFVLVRDNFLWRPISEGDNQLKAIGVRCFEEGALTLNSRWHSSK